MTIQSGKTSRWPKIIKTAELLVIIILLAVLLAIIYLGFFHWRFDAVLTGSMEPTYKIGGMVVIRPVDPVNVHIGDVITYKPPFEADFLITHRVIEIVKEGNNFGFITQGDAVDEPEDFVIPAENVIGGVWFYIPLFGYFARFVKTPFGFILCFLIPCILLIANEFRSRKQRSIIKKNQILLH